MVSEIALSAFTVTKSDSFCPPGRGATGYHQLQQEERFL